jgi:uncharacterized membrane protein
MSDQEAATYSDVMSAGAVRRFNTSRGIIRSLKTKADAKRSRAEKIADWMTESFGSFGFLLVNVAWFFGWLVLNIGIIPGIEPFDPFPFGMLTTIVSLEAIILAIFVLISQNREAKIAELREEIDLQVDIITEQEITKLIEMMRVLLEKNGVDLSTDEDLKLMLKPTDVDKLEKALEKQVLEGSQVEQS